MIDLIKEEGFREGIQQGIQQGRQEGRDEVVTRILEKSSLSPQEIASISGVDLSRIMSLANSLPPSSALGGDLSRIMSLAGTVDAPGDLPPLPELKTSS